MGNKVNKKFVESMVKATHFSEKVRRRRFHQYIYIIMMLIIIIVIVVIIIVIIMKMVTIKEIERLLELHHKKGTRDRMDRNEMAMRV